MHRGIRMYTDRVFGNNDIYHFLNKCNDSVTCAWNSCTLLTPFKTTHESVCPYSQDRAPTLIRRRQGVVLDLGDNLGTLSLQGEGSILRGRVGVCKKKGSSEGGGGGV